MRPIKGKGIEATSERQLEEDEELWETHSLPLPQGNPEDCPGSLEQKKRQEKKQYHKRSRGEKGVERNETPAWQQRWERTYKDLHYLLAQVHTSVWRSRPWLQWVRAMSHLQKCPLRVKAVEGTKNTSEGEMVNTQNKKSANETLK